MPNNEQIAKEYYSLIGEGAVCPKEDKNIKDYDQIVRLLKKGIAEIAKENDSKIIFSYKEDLCPWKWKEHTFNKYSHYMLSASLTSLLPDYISVRLCGNLQIDSVEISKLKYSQYNGILFAVNWIIKEPSEENLESLKGIVNKMKQEHYSCEKLYEIHSAALKAGLDKITQKYKTPYCIEQRYYTYCLVSFKLGTYYKLHVRINYEELCSQLSEVELALQKSLELNAMFVLPNISLNKNLIGE